MSPALDGSPDSDDLNDIIDTSAPDAISPFAGDGCVPDGWLWPTPIIACGDADYQSPNYIDVDYDPTEDSWMVNCYRISFVGDSRFGQYGPFESHDNAEAYKTYLSTCQKPRCDGGQGGSGVMRNGIKIINVIDTTAKAFTMAEKDFSGDVFNFKHDDDGTTYRTEAGGLTFWRFESRDGSFAGGSPAIIRTNRPEWNTGSETLSGVAGAKSRGMIGAADDPRDIEVTFIARVHGIADSSQGWSLKTRGNGHTNGIENTLTMSFVYPYSIRKDSLYGVEISHPTTTYRNVNIRKSDYMLPGEDKWIGIKYIVYNINNNSGIHCECWVDEDPIVPGTSNFRNNWVKVWDYEESRDDTPVWSGPAIQLIADQVEQQDLAAFEVVGIIAPKATAAMSAILQLNTDDNHSDEFTVADGDIMYDNNVV